MSSEEPHHINSVVINIFLISSEANTEMKWELSLGWHPSFNLVQNPKIHIDRNLFCFLTAFSPAVVLRVCLVDVESYMAFIQDLTKVRNVTTTYLPVD